MADNQEVSTDAILFSSEDNKSETFIQMGYVLKSEGRRTEQAVGILTSVNGSY